MKSTFAKVAIGFVIGATTVGGIATANINWGSSVTTACVDKKTGALFASTGTCAKSRTPVSLGGTPGSINGVVSQVSPAVVTVRITSANGGGTGSGSIFKTDANNSWIVTNNHVVDGATAITSGMITTYQQKIGSGYVIADNLADLPLDGNIGISTDTGLIRTRDTGSWSDWSQDVDASQVTSGRISADRLPFAPEQVVVNDIGNTYSPVYISSAGDWGWTGTTKT